MLKTKIKFETKTRCKERESMRKTYEKYAEIYDKLVENKVYGTLIIIFIQKIMLLKYFLIFQCCIKI